MRGTCVCGISHLKSTWASAPWAPKLLNWLEPTRQTCVVYSLVGKMFALLLWKRGRPALNSCWLGPKHVSLQSCVAKLCAHGKGRLCQHYIFRLTAFSQLFQSEQHISSLYEHASLTLKFPKGYDRDTSPAHRNVNPYTVLQNAWVCKKNCGWGHM